MLSAADWWQILHGSSLSSDRSNCVTEVIYEHSWDQNVCVLICFLPGGQRVKKDSKSSQMLSKIQLGVHILC